MRMQGDHITEEDIDAFIKQTDQNGDGYINYEGKVTTSTRWLSFKNSLVRHLLEVVWAWLSTSVVLIVD